MDSTFHGTELVILTTELSETFCCHHLRKHVFQHNFLTAPNEHDEDLCVKDHVLMTKESYIILG